MYHNSLNDSNSGKCVINILIFDFGTPDECIIFLDLVQNVLVSQNVTTSSPMYKSMEMLLKGDRKARFLQQANLTGSHTVSNFSVVMMTMTLNIFPKDTFKDRKQDLCRDLRKLKEVKARASTTK